jgi:hypothetical protein
MGRESQMQAKQDGMRLDEMLMMRRSWHMQLDPSMMTVLNVNPLNHQNVMASW